MASYRFFGNAEVEWRAVLMPRRSKPSSAWLPIRSCCACKTTMLRHEPKDV